MSYSYSWPQKAPRTGNTNGKSHAAILQMPNFRCKEAQVSKKLKNLKSLKFQDSGSDEFFQTKNTRLKPHSVNKKPHYRLRLTKPTVRSFAALEAVIRRILRYFRSMDQFQHHTTQFADNRIPRSPSLKTYDTAVFEGEIYRILEQNGYFRATDQCDHPGNKPFSLYVIPPPNVTGALHKWARSLHPNRFKYSRFAGEGCMGDKYPWLPGTDHAG
jgi:hypothetical protein